jgi:urease accessory protein
VNPRSSYRWLSDTFFFELETLEIIYSTDDHPPGAGEERVVLTVDRATLAKRRWRGVAGDGREFGFDVDHALSDGTVFYREAGRCYMIEQAPEPVLEIELGTDSARAALVGWQIGNLHFPIELIDLVIRCPDDPAIRQLLRREEVAWRATVAVFRPLTSAGHGHHHH